VLDLGDTGRRMKGRSILMYTLHS